MGLVRCWVHLQDTSVGCWEEMSAHSSLRYSLLPNTESHPTKEEKGFFWLNLPYLRRALENLNYCKGGQIQPHFLHSYPCPQVPKLRHFIGLSWLVWLKSVTIFQNDFWSREKCLWSCRTHLLWLTVHFFSPYFSLWLCNQEQKAVQNKLRVQNLLTFLLDVVLPAYILRLSKIAVICAWWHIASGGAFKTHNKLWETREKLTTTHSEFRTHVPWLSYGLHLSCDDALCSWQIVYGKVFGKWEPRISPQVSLWGE